MPDVAPRSAAPRFTAAAATDPGRLRTGNEDRLHLDAGRGIFVVADGVGGHAAGEVAAEIAVDVIARRLERPLWSPEQRVREAIALANNEILTQARSSPHYDGMTCVLTLALLSDRTLTIGHVGDTRLYRLTPDGMTKLTHDHSPIGEREDSGEISEAEAMQHPRRNQVFRDVGSEFHEPDDPDFVEVIEAPFDEQTAVLLCSDGLSDMLTSAVIERTVRQHAGHPEQVVEALILAANEAGGKDNVTAIYVEGAGFAHAPRTALQDAYSAVTPAVDEVRRSVAGLWRSRAVFLAMGLLAGLALGIGLAWLLARYAPLGTTQGRTLRVLAPGAAGSAGSFASIIEALRDARPRDIVQLDPGEYAEGVVLPDGVSLEAKVPGSATLVARPGQADWVSIIAGGRAGHRISGIRVRGQPEAPIAVGLELSGHAISVEDVEVEGEVGIGINFINDGDITVFASRISNLKGLPLHIGAGAHPVIRQNHVVHESGAKASAIDVSPDAAADIDGNIVGNLFIGYGEIVKGAAARDAQLAPRNFIQRGPERAPPPRTP
jgi:PPM family protein phosphatase